MTKREAQRMKLRLLLLLLIFTLIATACGSSASPSPDNIEDIEIENPQIQPEIEEIKEEIDIQALKPNEAGQIMVLMYHHIAEPEAEWVRTPENFRKDLQVLYEKGYRPISLNDYALGNITTEAGYTPVVLTFDDGRQNNFNMIENEKGDWIIDPDCAVAILEEFHTAHQDFPLEATFFVNNNVPFGQQEHLEFKLKYIIDKGMDIGNHTATHVDFTKVDAPRIQKELAGIVELIERYLPEYQVNTLALPFGSRPKEKDLYQYLEIGIHEGFEYKNNAILNVGWDPYKSPYHREFNPLAIHRIRASELQKFVQGVGMYDWLDQFDKGSRTKYISDGDPHTVTIPESFIDAIEPQRIGEREIRTYIIEK